MNKKKILLTGSSGFIGKNILFFLGKSFDIVEVSRSSNYDIDNFDYDGSDVSNMLGQKISVYMESIGQEIDEYLVNFNYFVDIMKKYGFVPELPKLHPNFKNKLKQPIDSFIETINNIDKKVYNNDRNFTKYKNIKDILNIPELKELSSMNNYFVFKKL